MDSLESKDEASVCVLMATFNGQSYLREQIASIRMQQGCNCKIVARDDGSTDRTLDILNENEIEILPSQQKFVGASMNFMLLIQSVYYRDDFSKFDYVALSDQDDIWFPNKLRMATEKLDSGYDCYSSGFYNYTRKGSRWVKGRYISKSFQIKKFSYLARSPGPGFTYVFKASAISKICSDPYFKGITSNAELCPHWHDWALFAFAKKLRLSWTIDRDGFAYYRIHDKNHTGRLSVNSLRKRLTFFFKGKFFHQMYLAALISDDKRTQERMRVMGFWDRIFFLSKILELRSSFIERFFLFLLILITPAINNER